MRMNAEAAKKGARSVENKSCDIEKLQKCERRSNAYVGASIAKRALRAKTMFGRELMTLSRLKKRRMPPHSWRSTCSGGGSQPLVVPCIQSDTKRRLHVEAHVY